MTGTDNALLRRLLVTNLGYHLGRFVIWMTLHPHPRASRRPRVLSVAFFTN